MRPISSRSLCLPPARTHFWTSATRGGSNGTGSSPRKYGTNCIIPEFVNIGAVGWCGIRLADGTSVCCRAREEVEEGAAQLVGVHAVRPARLPAGRAVELGVGCSASRSRIASRPSATAARRSAPRRSQSARRGRPTPARACSAATVSRTKRVTQNDTPKPKPTPTASQKSRLNTVGLRAPAAAERPGGAAGAGGEGERLDDRVREREVGEARRGVDRGRDRLGGAEQRRRPARARRWPGRRCRAARRPPAAVSRRSSSTDSRRTRQRPGQRHEGEDQHAATATTLAIGDDRPRQRRWRPSSLSVGRRCGWLRCGHALGDLLFEAVGGRRRSRCVPAAAGGRYSCGDPAPWVVVRIVVARRRARAWRRRGSRRPRRWAGTSPAEPLLHVLARLPDRRRPPGSTSARSRGGRRPGPG